MSPRALATDRAARAAAGGAGVHACHLHVWISREERRAALTEGTHKAAFCAGLFAFWGGCWSRLTRGGSCCLLGVCSVLCRGARRDLAGGDCTWTHASLTWVSKQSQLGSFGLIQETWFDYFLWSVSIRPIKTAGLNVFFNKLFNVVYFSLKHYVRGVF